MVTLCLGTQPDETGSSTFCTRQRLKDVLVTAAAGEVRAVERVAVEYSGILPTVMRQLTPPSTPAAEGAG